MAEFNETVIDHVGGIGCSDEWCGVSTGEISIKNRLEQLAEKYPQEVECVAKNSDGSVYYHVPWEWVKIKPPKIVSEEVKARLAEYSKLYGFKKSVNDNHISQIDGE